MSIIFPGQGLTHQARAVPPSVLPPSLRELIHEMKPYTSGHRGWLGTRYIVEDDAELLINLYLSSKLGSQVCVTRPSLYSAGDQTQSFMHAR